MAAPSPTTVSLKLLIAPKSQRVLYAEAGKDFVDFLFNIMSLPVGTVVRLLSKQGIEGCIGNIYESIENLGDSYMQSATIKDMLLKPMVTNYASNVALLLPRLQSSTHTNLYKCDSNYSSQCFMNVTNEPNTNCPSCNRYSMRQNLTFVNPTNKPSYSGEVGFVKGVATYMIMDDLVVRLMSTESIITLFNKFNIKDVGDLEVKVVSVGANEAVELLRALIWSKVALTSVFLGGKKKPSTNLKLLVDITSRRVLFAESGKDFVAFLFYILPLPIGKQEMVGSLGNLYDSLENMNDTYIQPSENIESSEF